MPLWWDESFHPQGGAGQSVERAMIREGREVWGSRCRNWAARATQLPQGGWVQRWEVVILNIGGGGFSIGVAGEQWTGQLGACAVIDDEGAVFGDWCSSGIHVRDCLGDLHVNDRLQFSFLHVTGAVTVSNLSRGCAVECLCVLPSGTDVYPVAAGTGTWAVRLENYVDEEPCVLTLHMSQSAVDRLVDCAFTNVGGDELVALSVDPETTVSELWDRVSRELSQHALEFILPEGRILKQKQDGTLKLCEVMLVLGANGDADSSNQDAV